MLKSEEFIQRAENVEASARRVSDPAYRETYLELAKAFRDLANVRTEDSAPPEKHFAELVERMIRKTKTY